MSIRNRFIGAALTLGLLIPYSRVEADPSKEFLMSCTYGVLAGTLVGAASLAFTSQPGDNLRNIARGASLGLYTGILLGAYVVYLVPGQDESNNSDPESKPQDGDDDTGASNYQVLPEDSLELVHRIAKKTKAPFLVEPLFSQGSRGSNSSSLQLSGARVLWTTSFF
jgi:hypothetical protein